jgi:hypothetical protein
MTWSAKNLTPSGFYEEEGASCPKNLHTEQSQIAAASRRDMLGGSLARTPDSL